MSAIQAGVAMCRIFAADIKDRCWGRVSLLRAVSRRGKAIKTNVACGLEEKIGDEVKSVALYRMYSAIPYHTDSTTVCVVRLSVFFKYVYGFVMCEVGWSLLKKGLISCRVFFSHR